MNFVNDKTSCRVDFFKTSGKWYATEAIIFRDKDYKEISIHKAFRHALYDTVKLSYLGMQAVCLEPYHACSYPISLIWDGKQDE
jgi:hypothetical protein